MLHMKCPQRTQLPRISARREQAFSTPCWSPAHLTELRGSASPAPAALITRDAVALVGPSGRPGAAGLVREDAQLPRCSGGTGERLHSAAAWRLPQNSPRPGACSRLPGSVQHLREGPVQAGQGGGRRPRAGRPRVSARICPPTGAHTCTAVECRARPASARTGRSAVGELQAGQKNAA